MKPVNLQQHVMAMAKQYGSFRELGRAVGLDHTYLFRLARSEKANPSARTLDALGLERIVAFKLKGARVPRVDTRSKT